MSTRAQPTLRCRKLEPGDFRVVPGRKVHCSDQRKPAPTNVSRPGTKKLLAASLIPRVDGASDCHEETVLRGRRRERKVLQRLLEGVRTGESRALVLRGEPGVGKTALLEYVVERAPGRVMRAAGVQSEMELAFAGLHQLCSPMMDRLECVPAPQRTRAERGAGAGSLHGGSGRAGPDGRGGAGAAAGLCGG